eukprot:5415651-Pyramimonas_sp.AAC.1
MGAHVVRDGGVEQQDLLLALRRPGHEVPDKTEPANLPSDPNAPRKSSRPRRRAAPTCRVPTPVPTRPDRIQAYKRTRVQAYTTDG